MPTKYNVILLSARPEKKKVIHLNSNVIFLN